eukprot:3207185-Rhodomonas_salina.3
MMRATTRGYPGTRVPGTPGYPGRLLNELLTLGRVTTVTVGNFDAGMPERVKSCLHFRRRNEEDSATRVAVGIPRDSVHAVFLCTA